MPVDIQGRSSIAGRNLMAEFEFAPAASGGVGGQEPRRSALNAP
ncbi:MAG TPA: hypothetical protein VK025_05860 [Steroidobacter sp.]|nr:hypothetical protein [Steroidobacter sp.]